MKNKIGKPELLSPAGNMEALQAALDFGADAVYLGGEQFSMRSSPINFTPEALAEGVRTAHHLGKKVYVALNILPRSSEIEGIGRFIRQTVRTGADAFIVSDLGVFDLVRRLAPEADIHVSTQAGVVNYSSANAFYRAGAKRIVTARELTLEEISEIRRMTPEGLEIEAFVHGSMCVSFSGRCLLSSYLTGRDSNHGDCAQPCRWKYALSEERNPGVFYPVEEDSRGTYLLNSRDLCMIGHIPEMAAAGISSLKIEGRAKSAYYTAAVTNAYRLAIDSFFDKSGEAADIANLKVELLKVSHRPYCTGFYFGAPEKGQDYAGGYLGGYRFLARVRAVNGGVSECTVHNVFSAGMNAEALEPGKTGRPVTIEEIYNPDGELLNSAGCLGGTVFLRTSGALQPGAILRIRESGKPE